MDVANYELVEKFARKHARARSSTDTWSNITLAAKLEEL